MKNNIVNMLRPVLLLVIVMSLFAAGRSTPAHVKASEPSRLQEAARESVASCDFQNYKVPEIAEGTLEEGVALSPNSEGPVLADMGLFIEEIPEVNEITNTFNVEGLMDIVWCDPRLKYENKGQGAYELFLEADAESKLESIWWPDLTFVNEVSTRDSSDKEVVIHENGTVEYREKFTVTIEAQYELSKFPFDKQTLEIEIQSFAWDSRYLQIHIEEQFVGFSDAFEIPEWHTDQVSTRVESLQQVGDRNPFSEFLMTIDVTRQFGFYIWKVLLPLIILVIMCFAVFWMDDESLSSRLSVGFTGVLTVVAYQFIATGSLPKVPYMTLMDTYIAFSFIVMVLTIFQSIIVSGYNKDGRNELALKIDQKSRYLYPLFYLLGIGILTLIFMLRR